MGIYFSNSTLTSLVENGKSVIESDNLLTFKSPISVASRSAGAVTAASVEYVFHSNRILENEAVFNTTTGRFTAPKTGVYFVYVWVMTHNGAIYNNRNWRIRINNAGTIQQVYCYSSNISANHTHMEGSIVVSLVENDFVSMWTSNAPLYGSNERYARFCCFYLG